MDIAKRSSHNPLMRPQDLKPCIPGMEITCLLNPGVFRMNGKTWLVLRVAERPVQKEGVISFPILGIVVFCFCFDRSSRLVSIRLRTTCIFDSKLEATCSSWPKLGQVDSSWSVLPTCLAGVHGELHGCSRSRVSGAGHPPSIHVD